MKGAILVLKHMPTCCADCPFIEYIGKDTYKCSKYHETLNSIEWLDEHLHNNIMERRTEWCPLIKEPERCEIEPTDEEYMKHYKQGINDTIALIRGELMITHSE